MAEMIKLIESDSPSLKLKLSPCSEDLNRMELKMKLIDHMKFYQGVGLSANQIGIMERVFVMYSDVKKKEVITCFNPNIISVSPKKTLMDEGFEFIGIEREKEYFEIAEQRVSVASPLEEFMKWTKRKITKQ